MFKLITKFKEKIAIPLKSHFYLRHNLIIITEFNILSNTKITILSYYKSLSDQFVNKNI